mmetsp:Transcript_37248/g.55522  ORF Transcript_37248/g.55522 Transcript_37248/m.55522 type:complete len:95 (+) Transcript_37248:179-463(+)
MRRSGGAKARTETFSFFSRWSKNLRYGGPTPPKQMERGQAVETPPNPFTRLESNQHHDENVSERTGSQVLPKQYAISLSCDCDVDWLGKRCWIS